MHLIHGCTLHIGLNIECMIHEKTTQIPMGRSHALIGKINHNCLKGLLVHNLSLQWHSIGETITSCMYFTVSDMQSIWFCVAMSLQAGQYHETCFTLPIGSYGMSFFSLHISYPLSINVFTMSANNLWILYINFLIFISDLQGG